MTKTEKKSQSVQNNNNTKPNQKITEWSQFNIIKEKKLESKLEVDVVWVRVLRRQQLLEWSCTP